MPTWKGQNIGAKTSLRRTKVEVEMQLIKVGSCQWKEKAECELEIYLEDAYISLRSQIEQQTFNHPHVVSQ